MLAYWLHMWDGSLPLMVPLMLEGAQISPGIKMHSAKQTVILISQGADVEPEVWWRVALVLLK